MNSFFAPELAQKAKSSLFDVSHWGPFCDVTLALKQARQADNGAWVKIDEHQCKRAFRLFMNRLDHAVYGNAVRRHNKRLRVLPVLEKGKSALERSGESNAVITGDGTFIAPSSCPPILMLLHLGS